MNGYELSRNWFDWSFENPEKVSPNHSALYFFAIEHCNRLGWRKKFGFPTEMAKDAIGIKSYNTYIKTLNDLVDWGFINMIERSKNQYSSNIIALSNFDKALDKALDEAIVKHVTKQSESISSIDKPLTIEPLNHKLNEIPNFEVFLLYAKEKEPSVLQSALKNKYDAWIENKWRDGNDKPIKNWKVKLLQTMPYIEKIKSNGKQQHNNRS
jgi:hypothetical protein